MPADTIVSRLLRRAAEDPQGAAHYVKQGGRWQPSSWSDYARDVTRAARALIALGFAPGQSVAILGFNTREWVILDVACMAAGGAPAGIYTTSSSSEIAYIAGHCEALVLLVDKVEQWKRVEPILHELPKLARVVTMPCCEPIQHERVITWEAFLALGDGVPESAVHERVAALEPDGVATLIYTSGTTGPPKAVMLSHDNLSWTADVGRKLFASSPGDCGLSYLPLSHIAEQSLSIHGPITQGIAIYFAESMLLLADNLKEVQPTIFFGVPRVWEKFHAVLSGKLAEAKGGRARLVAWARGVATRVVELRKEGKEPGGLLALQYRLATRLVFSKLKPALGMGKAHMCVSGAAPISEDVLRFFQSIDILIHEVYGQSEDTGPTSFCQIGHVRFGTVGQPLPGVEVKIADDGEILVHGRNVFLGYYKDPAATAEALSTDADGRKWLHSGDLGALDADRFLRITGRKKEILITAGGKNIAPKNIEAALKQLPLVEEAVVIGDRRKYLTALLTLNVEAARKHAGLPDADAEALAAHPSVRGAIDEHLVTVNRDLARVEQVKHVHVLPRSLTIDHGELTPTLKVKRRKVNENWSAAIESMYTDEKERAAG